MKITLKDGSVKEYDQSKSVIDIAADISEGLARVATAGEVNGEIVDLRTVIDEDCELSILTFNDEKGKGAFRHTASHIMAQAVKRLYPDAKLAIGPSVADGFYYDIDREVPLVAEDLEKIEAEMKKIVKEALPIEQYTMPRNEAIAYFKEKGEPYKVELIEDLPEDEVISFYSQGEFTDLCAGPHLMTTKPVKAIKLTSLAGAYWRGSEKNKMLQRIYGTAYPKKAELDEYLHMIEEAKKRDHRKLGKELGLFMMRDEGPGFPFFLPKGMVLKNQLLDYWREIHHRNGYVEIATPIMLSRHLWETSGHWDHYKDNMYTTVIDEEDFAIKPMNCPGGILAYEAEPRSYRDLPLRMGELGLVHRHEKSGQLHGLMRVRCFTQDDAHIFMMPEQIRDEIKGVARLIDEVYSLFGFKYHVELSTRPENSMGSDEDWEMATSALQGALDDLGLNYVVNEGDGAFYGPKIDFHLEDSIGRTWQCGTIQLDFQLPLRFNLEYTGADGEKHRPIMIHRVAFGSIERFIGILIEHFAGAFPTWLAPVQVKVLPISDKYMEYGKKVLSELEHAGIRAEIDTRAEKIGYKIREAQMQKIPYMLVVGAKEEEDGLVSVRSRFEGDEGQKNLSDFVAAIKMEIAAKTVREVKSKE
ncbi:threonine--tRNA ligase [Bariatricus massiliensis]|uniref:Threonine--tRNA ligase n=1 Tax=Bariatricus massiliensis TaxID=1745713 RepID=A0ABS8DC01_9FIRM|nr:threonine--tRNA ligase [Bariatricus massiliensis]MCB7303582.1 threonine--tRNA ligase [Bariatricus massiliensis]MCB7372997.1 threonine--tRNA ligase [Bariatricus massiliensis]MCB7385667.1 threonine--tRNA ligase [Bariatricus massiliensis]MCB7409830.1 threonine--tRNA ligase [Bariatricus massiliensis]MCQ5254060.1 threonine--tRNA ligase [Bariatricus massiliensis]